MHEEDIVCGVYKLTNPAEVKYPVILKTAEDGHHMGRMLEDGNCLLDALKIPGGFLKISKEALRKWVKKFPDNWLHPENQKIYTFFLMTFAGTPTAIELSGMSVTTAAFAPITQLFPIFIFSLVEAPTPKYEHLPK